MSKRVFISYRREDTASAAGRIYDRLAGLLSKSNVFFDVSTIAGGDNFDAKIVSAIQLSDAILIFIGKNWLQPGHQSDPRIWDKDDYVRAEVRAALEGTALVLPVLVDGAQMSHPEGLPTDLRSITAKNALPLRHERFDDDAENIITTILGGSPKARIWDRNGNLVLKIGYILGGVIVSLIILAGIALVHFWILALPLSASIGDPATTLMLIVSPILGAWIGLVYEARKRRRRA